MLPVKVSGYKRKVLPEEVGWLEMCVRDRQAGRQTQASIL